jgi:hypothetical protein
VISGAAGFAAVALGVAGIAAGSWAGRGAGTPTTAATVGLTRFAVANGTRLVTAPPGSRVTVRDWARARLYLEFRLPSGARFVPARLTICVRAASRTRLLVFATTAWSGARGARPPALERRLSTTTVHAKKQTCLAVVLAERYAASGRAQLALVGTSTKPVFVSVRGRGVTPRLLVAAGPSSTPGVSSAAPAPAPAPRPAPPVAPTPTVIPRPAPPTTTTTAPPPPTTTVPPPTTTAPTTTAPPPTTTPSGRSVVVAAAGDVACDPGDPAFNGGNGTATLCHEKQTAAIVRRIAPSVVLGLGDMQYEDGAYDKYLASYDATWGSFKSITYPTVGGSHDAFATPTSGYCRYFGSNACVNGRTYYSLDVGPWHVISLDADCTQVGGCGPGSTEEAWLRADLAAHPAACTLAFWHFPRWTIGEYSDDARTDTFVRDLYAAHADLILTGHDHIYARFAPQTPDGAPSANGIREFVVGTGGKNHLPSPYSLDLSHPNLQVANDDTYGVLKLTLRATGYDWQFVPDTGSPGSFTDSGSASCH